MYTVTRYEHRRFWAVYCGQELVCVTVYRKGAAEVARRLNTLTATRNAEESRHAG